MKISELMLAVGDDNIVFQNLMHDAQSIDLTKNGTKITFYTNAVTPTDFMDVERSKNIGLVLWLPRELVNAAMKTKP